MTREKVICMSSGGWIPAAGLAVGLMIKPLYERFCLRPLERWLRRKKNWVARLLVFEIGPRHQSPADSAGLDGSWQEPLNRVQGPRSEPPG